MNWRDAPRDFPYSLDMSCCGYSDVLREIRSALFVNDVELSSVLVTAPARFVTSILDSMENIRVEKINGKNNIIWPQALGDIRVYCADKKDIAVKVHRDGELIIVIQTENVRE